MTETPDTTKATTPAQGDAATYLIPAGKILVVHQRWSQTNGAEECVGLFRALTDFHPVKEHAEYAKQNPSVNPDPKTWDKDARNAFLRWEIEVRKVLEDAAPFYLFLEPFPEAPKGPAPDAAQGIVQQ